LLAVAADLFRRRGYAGTTTRELAGLLGMQSASLYHHMGRKEDLLYQLSIDALTRIKSDVEGAMAAGGTPLERLRALIRTHVATALADQDKHAAMLIELRALSDVRRAEVLGLRDAYEAVVRDAIASAQHDGSVRGDLRPKDLALALLSLLNWSIFWFRPTGELTAATHASTLSTVFLEGALAAPRAEATG
jgi:AcrR family transcriptional regulator